MNRKRIAHDRAAKQTWKSLCVVAEVSRGDGLEVRGARDVREILNVRDARDAQDGRKVHYISNDRDVSDARGDAKVRDDAKRLPRAFSRLGRDAHRGRGRRYHRYRAGAIFIVALGITLVLSAMLLVYVQEMRTESVTAANRSSSAAADAVEQGAEQWVMAQLEANIPPLGTAASSSTSGSGTSTAVDPTAIPAEALQVGKGYFWLLHPDPTQDQLYGFGIVDESSKLNLNGASDVELSSLPNMTQDIATEISSWSQTAGPSGAAINYETAEELLLVDNMTELTPQILYGYDLNHDGVIDDNERSAANGAAVTNGTTSDSRGIFNYVTTFSTNATPGTAGTTAATVRGRRIIPRTIGLINVNTAPAQVLACLPGLTAADAQTLVTARAPASLGDTTWVSTALGQSKAQGLAPYITGVSYQYSADIVAVSGDGRAFKRVRIVVDARAQPAKIVYRKDLTYLGFPLPERVRTSLQTGKGIPSDLTGTTNKQTTGGF